MNNSYGGYLNNFSVFIDRFYNIIENSLRLINIYEEDIEGINNKESIENFIKELKNFKERYKLFEDFIHNYTLRILNEKYRVENSIKNEDCPICFEKVEDYYTIPCKHLFCKECMKKWYYVNNSCPLCKQIL